jgi:hypothetical protein
MVMMMMVMMMVVGFGAQIAKQSLDVHCRGISGSNALLATERTAMIAQATPV